MTAEATIYVICSDLARNGKTLLARTLTDHLLLEGRDPYCFDLSAPEGTLRAYFPGRTTLIDFSEAAARERLFGTILGMAGRDYVIDVAANRLAEFREAAVNQGFPAAAQDAGFYLCVLYIVDRDEKSLHAAVSIEDALLPDLFVPVVNRFIGSALPEGVPGPTLVMTKIDPELHAIISHRRFSLRNFMLGDNAGVPPRMQANLRNFLHGLQAGLREFEPALSLRQLQATEI
ncbi:hypothetical protein [Aestuariivirga sp.]|jgi:hypothetical protein|uniref:hypothetical protein n=1 Tax=Aestuariivirga sp. TaxID=2650926 RepID=UPI003784F95A